MSIDGSYFKWRMHSSAIAFAKTFIQIFFDKTFNHPSKNNENETKNQINIKCDIKINKCPDIIIIEDMIDLNLFSNIINSYINNNIKYIYFMHENQLTIPWKSNDRDIDKYWIYGYQNYKCMLGSHEIWWNSKYHANDFFDHLPKIIRNKSNDDWTAINMIKYVKQKSKSDMYIPMDLNKINKITLELNQEITNKKKQIKETIILWNARWEEDKNPSLFLYALRHIKKIKNINSFKLVILGEDFSYSKDSKHSQQSQSIFNIIYDEFKENILQFGYVKSYKEYIFWLNLSDILIMTSIHEFFGISLIESIHCRTIPILPNNLVYVEHFQAIKNYPYFYNHKSKGDLVKKLINILQIIHNNQPNEVACIKNVCKQIASNYNAIKICEHYDKTISDLQLSN